MRWPPPGAAGGTIAEVRGLARRSKADAAGDAPVRPTGIGLTVLIGLNRVQPQQAGRGSSVMIGFRVIAYGIFRSELRLGSLLPRQPISGYYLRGCRFCGALSSILLVTARRHDLDHPADS